MAESYLFRDSQGRLLGPADLSTIRGWLNEGVLQPDSRLQRAEGGGWLAARDLLGGTMMSAAPNSPTSPPVDLRPMSTGEMVDRTFQVYRRHFLKLFLLASLVQGVIFALIYLSPAGNVQLVEGVTNPAGLLFSSQHLADILAGLMKPAQWLPLVAIFPLSFAMDKLGMSALTICSSDLYFGQERTFKKTIGSLRGHVAATIWTQAIFYVALIVTLLLPILALVGLLMLIDRDLIGLPLALGLAILSLGLFAPFLLVEVRFILAPQAVMVEGLSGWKALRRSSELTRYDPGLGFWYWGETRLSLLLLVYLITSLLVLVLSFWPYLLVMFTDMLRGGALGASEPSNFVSILQPVLRFLGASIVTPIYVVGTTIFYYDIRVRKEGYDLELMAQNLQTATPMEGR